MLVTGIEPLPVSQICISFTRRLPAWHRHSRSRSVRCQAIGL